jgi:diacylglycerol O-acyltransferase
VDGVAAMRYMEKATSKDPNAKVIPLWALPPKPSSRVDPVEIATSPLRSMVQAASKIGSQAGSTRKVAQEVLRSIRARKKDPDYVSVFQAPKTIFNKRISGGRRFAAQSWDMARIKAIGKTHGATLNDVTLAMCASALRKYLLELDALPEKPLIAMVPVSMRTDDSEGGNQVAMILANLATHQSDPVERLATIKRSVNNSKERFARMNQQEIMGYISTVMAVHGVNMALGINPGWQAFNIVISNVPGPRETLYWNGAKVEGVYPVSIAADGMALNITLTSYVDNLEFGVIGCRRTLPHMQRLLQYLEDGLTELE